MRKRIFSCILLAVLVFSLSGCGPTILQGEDEGTSESGQETEENTEENVEENTTTEATGESADELLAKLEHYCEEMDAEQLPEENQWVSAYAEQVLYLMEAYKERCEEIDIAFKYKQYYFNLIYLNEDDIPELVAGPLGQVSIYTYEAGEAGTSNSGTLHTVMDQWGYGGSGNYGYDYLPGKNVIYNLNVDHAGAIRYLSYLSMNEEYELDGFVLRYDYVDEDGNAFWGQNDEESEPLINYYYICDDTERELSKKEFDSYQIQGDYASVVDTKNCLEIMEKLYQYYLTFGK